MSSKMLLSILSIFVITTAYYFVLQPKPKTLPKTSLTIEDTSKKPPENLLVRSKKKQTAPVTKTPLKEKINQQKHSLHQEKILEYEEEIQKSPQNAEAHFALAKIYLTWPGKTSLAHQHFHKAIELSPEHPRKEYIKKHITQLQIRELFEQLKKHKQPYLENPEVISIFLRLGEIYHEQENYQRALFFYKKATGFETNKKEKERILALLQEVENKLGKK